jgi:hypothetical protein
MRTPYRLLISELSEAGLAGNIIPHPNSRKTFDSYNWSLAKMLRTMRLEKRTGCFDFVYLDGAHAFQHDSSASLIIKQLLLPGGIILFDDYLWTFASSPTRNPKINKYTADHYSDEQINEPHIKLICELFFDHDRNFEMVDLGYKGSEWRRAYRKAGG